MTNIEKKDIGTYTVSGEFDIPCSLSADDDSKRAGEGVSVTLRFKLENTPVLDIIQSSLKDKRINFQSTGRKHLGNYKTGQILQVNYTGGRAPIDPKASTTNYLNSMNKEERLAWLKEQGLI